MVEELKLAIKVDDDAIEQSLLKQFANAEKMTNKVVLTFNNIDLDDKAIEAKFKEMQKMAGKNPIDLSIDKSSIEMLSAISKQLGNIFDIAKGKSIIDSSATVSEINKITNAVNDLNSSLNKPDISSLQQEEKQIQKNIDSLKKLLDLKYEIKNVNKSSYSGKGNVDWIGIYKSQEEAISSDLSDRKEKLHSSLNLILSEDKNALISLEEEANRLKASLQSVQDMSNRISSNSSISYLDKNKGSEEWYKGYAEAYKAIDDRLKELNNQYKLTNDELEEYITLQVKAEKIMERMISHSGGVQGSGAKNKSELKSWIEKSFAADLGLNPEDVYSGLFGNITDALYDGNGISLFDSEGTKRSLREISAEILNYKSILSGISGAFGVNEDAEKLREFNSILNYIKNNASDIESTDFSSQIKKATELVDYYSKKLSEGEHTDFYSKSLKEAQDDLQNLISLQKRLDRIKVKQNNEIISEQQSSSVVEQQNKIQEELKETQKQAEQTSEALSNIADGNKSNISSGTQMKDVFQDGTTSAEKLEEEIKNIDSATEKASESAKEYRKILSQVGEFDIDSKVSAMYKRNDGQLESWTWRAKKDDEGNILYDQDGKIDYDEPTITVISKYEQLEKIIVKADNELRNLQKDLSEIKAYDPTASTTNIEAKISDQKEYIQLLEQTVKAISQSDEYLLDEQQIIEARNKAAREYALTTGAKQEKTDAKQSASDEKKRLANIEQVNRALNKQQITIDAIEKTYNKTTNPDLDREVSNQQDLAELAQKKLAIQTKINSLQSKERNPANEKEFLELEKLIAEYKELAKYKLKANNPSKQELGGQNLQTLIQVQISNYDKLITKAEKYGDATSDTIEKLKEQRDILSKIGSDGKYSATADQYYTSRDTYKVESAALSAFEAETRAIEQKRQAVKKLSDELKSYNNQIPKKPVDGQRSDYFEGFVQKYKEAIEEARKYFNTLGDSPVTEEVKKEWERLISVIKKAKEEMDAVPNAARGSDADARMKEIDKLTKYLDKNTRISKEAKEQLEGYLALLKSDNPSVNVKELHTAWTKVAVAEREAGREGKSFLDIFKNKIVYNYAAQLAGYYLSFMDIIRYAKQGTDAVKEFDDGLTKISYTMDMTKSKLNDLGQSVLDMASDMKSSVDDAMSVAQIYANMQTTAEEIQKLSEPTLILTNLSGFDSSTIADDIQAVNQQFDILAEDSMHIADVYDYISRNIAVDYSKGLNAMAEGLQVSGSTAKQAGLSFEQTASIIAKAVEKTRLEGSQVGNGLKTIMTRLSKVGELSDEVDNETLSQASESLKKVGIEVYNLDGSYREFDVIMGELANKWSDLTDAEKSNISFAIAATRQTNLLSAVLSNFSDSMQLAEEATNANGSALENQQKYMESFSGHLQSLETEAKIAWINILDSETLKGGVDLLTGLVKVVGQLVDKFGLLGTAGLVGGGILSKNGIG